MFLTSIFKRKNGDNEGVIIAFRNKGKYVYERKGLLDEILNILINPIRSIIRLIG